MPSSYYEIEVIGSLSPAAREAFAGMRVAVAEVEPAVTVLTGHLDQRGLRALLDRARALGLELVGIRRGSRAAG